MPDSGEKIVSGMWNEGDWPGEAPGRLPRSRVYYITVQENRSGFLWIVQLETGIKKRGTW